MTYRNRSASIRGIELSGGKCIICDWVKYGLNGNSLVEGAHVRPYESGYEFDDYDNIIALCPNHHTEFDAFNFYIDPNTYTVHFRNSGEEYDGLMVKDKVKHIKKEYLAYAKYIYDKNNSK